MSTTGDAPLSLIKPSAGDAIDLAVINSNYDTINTGVASTNTAVAVLAAKFPVSVSNLESTLAASVATIGDKAPIDSPVFTTNVRVPAKIQFANDDYISYDDASNEFSFDKDMSSGGTAGNAGISAGYLKVGGRRLWVQAADPSTSAAVGDLWIDLP